MKNKQKGEIFVLALVLLLMIDAFIIEIAKPCPSHPNFKSAACEASQPPAAKP